MNGLDTTTPKLSSIKQYYDLGFYKSVTQMGQHEDGLFLPSILGHQLGKLMVEGPRMTYRYLRSHSGLWDWCWLGPQLVVGQNLPVLSMVCLWATLWWQLTSFHNIVYINVFSYEFMYLFSCDYLWLLPILFELVALFLFISQSNPFCYVV